MIALGCDHGGYKLKEEIKKYLEEKEIPYKDFGTNSQERTDYPIYAEKVAKSLQAKECDSGILICTTGLGMCMAANKFKGIRAAVCSDEALAKQAKEHSNVNVLVLPVAFTDSKVDNDETLEAIQIALNGSDEETGWKSADTFFKESSFGSLNPNYEVAPEWFQYHKSSYEVGTASANTTVSLLNEAVQWYKDQCTRVRVLGLYLCLYRHYQVHCRFCQQSCAAQTYLFGFSWQILS